MTSIPQISVSTFPTKNKLVAEINKPVETNKPLMRLTVPTPLFLDAKSVKIPSSTYSIPTINIDVTSCCFY